MKNLLSLFLFLALLFCSTYAQLPSGAVGVWRMDENTGTTTADDSGNNNDGTITGATWTTGVSGSALNFDGNDRVDIPDDASLRPGNISFSAWVRTSGTSTANMTILGKSVFSNATNEQYILYLNAGGVPQLAFKRNSGCSPGAGWQGVPGTTRVDDQQWHHLMATWDGSVARMYVDGVLEGTNSSAPAGNLDNCIGGNLRFGVWWAGDQIFFNGDLDEIYIFDRALNQTEVSQLSAPPAANNPVPTLSEWGLILLGLGIMALGTVVVWRKKTESVPV